MTVAAPLIKLLAAQRVLLKLFLHLLQLQKIELGLIMGVFKFGPEASEAGVGGSHGLRPGLTNLPDDRVWPFVPIIKFDFGTAVAEPSEQSVDRLSLGRVIVLNREKANRVARPVKRFKDCKF